MLCACAAASAATVYKWVDDNGVTHYSDQPNPKAQKLEIADAQTYASKQAAVAVPAAAPPSASAPGAAAVAVCAIDSPGAGQVFLDTYSISGHVTLAHVGVGSQTTLRLDGQDISGQMQADGAFTIPQVDRGEHTLTVQVTNSRGDVACQGNSISFSVRQRTAGGGQTVPMAPQAPGAPKAPGVGAPH